MDASELTFERDYPNFPEFEEYCVDMSKVNVNVIHALQQFRSSTGILMIPSPAEGAITRINGRTSRHAIDNGRLSDAIDFFPDPQRFFKCLTLALIFKPFGGVGFYPDTDTGPMLHVDCRPYKSTGFKTIWCRCGGTYYYPTQVKFWKILNAL